MPHGILGVLQYCLPMGDMHFTAGQRRSGRHVHVAARTKRAGIDASVSFICCCARTPPVKAGEAVIDSTGLPLSTERP
jgi:hypothetical protein